MKTLKIGFLYGDVMNTYGDRGNINCLEKRLEWRGINAETKIIKIGDAIKPGDFDLYFFGGGQDAGQQEVGPDLLKLKAKTLQTEAKRGVPMLAICGGYQLFGEYYLPANGQKIEGVGILPCYTKASDQRMIGNVVVELAASSLQSAALVHENGSTGLAASSLLPAKSLLVGFENHSGQTFVTDKTAILGNVVSGFGNNGQDKTEGCIYNHVIGCYLHGSLLPKNPLLADWLIKTALEVKYKEMVDLEVLDDSLENHAHSMIVQRIIK